MWYQNLSFILINCLSLSLSLPFMTCLFAIILTASIFFWSDDAQLSLFCFVHLSSSLFLWFFLSEIVCAQSLVISNLSLNNPPFSSLNFQLYNTFLYAFCFLFSLTSIFTPARVLIPSEVSTKIVSSFIPSSLSPNASNKCLEREWFRNERKNLQILIPTCLPADDWVAKVQCRKLKGLTLKSDPPRPTARLKMCELLVIGDLLGPHLSSFVRWQGVRRGYLVADPS